MPSRRDIAPCLWFDTQAEEAANHYVSIFEDSKIESISRYGAEGFEIHRKPAGAVMTVSFRLRGQLYTALNGGPQFKFNEAISLQVFCESQQEVDDFWQKLIAGGGSPGPCGWLKDKFGLSWQVIPLRLMQMLVDTDAAKAGRVTAAYLQMQKFDIAALERAYAGR
jgi:predicted 3-demethylubiquinone-9 3-methyltransferase (glyoxalase superfamily)